MERSLNFILIGAAGYVAPRHMEAIKAVGGNLIAALDPHDSVGILDRYFPECEFFTQWERLDRHVHKLLSRGMRIDYVSVCSPNYLHDTHSRWALRIGADVICEKPVVLNERNLDGLQLIEDQTCRKVWNVLQLRLHPVLSNHDYPKPLDGGNVSRVHVEYATPRGNWYKRSWKGDQSLSGGLETNIGVHLFDLTSALFGQFQGLTTVYRSDTESVGVLNLERAKVHWDLSISLCNQPTRRFRINGMDYDLSDGFNNLHTEVYRSILRGEGFGLDDARQAIRICEKIRSKPMIVGGVCLP